MKKLVLLLLITAGTFAQDKTTTTIIVNTATTDSINRTKFTETLLDNDYYIDTVKAGVITTELANSKTKPNWSHQYQYKIRFKDGQIIIKPFWNTGITLNIGMVEGQAQNQKWKYSKGKNINGFIYRETLAMLSSAGYSDITFK